LKAFMVEALARPGFSLRGLSVTTPHKQNALHVVRDMSGELDETADRVGAVNTLAISADGSLRGFNTDVAAALASMKELLGNASGAEPIRCSVLGAGGVARAVVAAAASCGWQTTIFNRTSQRAVDLARDFSLQSGPWTDRESAPADIVVNCTTI